MTDASLLHAPDLEWQALVGKAILRFGDIESISLRCIAHLPTDKIAESAARLEFSRRADILIEILEGRPALTEPLAALLAGFKRANNNKGQTTVFLRPTEKTVLYPLLLTPSRSPGLT